jgi:hypothetical protein
LHHNDNGKGSTQHFQFTVGKTCQRASRRRKQEKTEQNVTLIALTFLLSHPYNNFLCRHTNPVVPIYLPLAAGKFILPTVSAKSLCHLRSLRTTESSPNTVPKTLTSSTPSTKRFVMTFNKHSLRKKSSWSETELLSGGEYVRCTIYSYYFPPNN